MISQIPYLDGNAAAGELNKVFTLDITAAEGLTVVIAEQHGRLPKPTCTGAVRGSSRGAVFASMCSFELSVNRQISPTSAQMVMRFVMLITSGRECSHFHETSGPREAGHTCRLQLRCMQLYRPQTWP
jgi:hypothetical protein